MSRRRRFWLLVCSLVGTVGLFVGLLIWNQRLHNALLGIGSTLLGVPMGFLVSRLAEEDGGDG